MRCEICDGEGMIGGAPCLECGGSGIGSCCDTAGSRMVHVRYEGLANPAMDTAMGSLTKKASPKAGQGVRKT